MSARSTSKSPARTAPAASTQVESFEPRQTIVDFIRQNQGLIAESLPKGMPPERFTRLVLTLLRKNPDLQRCSPPSFMGSILTAAALGLEIGLNNEAHLAPYNVKVYDPETGREAKRLEAQLIVGYGGYAKMFWQHPMAAALDAQAVYKGDVFEWEKGTQPYLRHKPSMSGEDRGDPIAYYAIAGLSNGAVQFQVFTPRQIAALRGGKIGPKGDIKDPEHWMERKTALVQTLKLMPKTTGMSQTLAVDEQPGQNLWAVNAAAQINTGSLVTLDAVPAAEPDIDTATGEVTYTQQGHVPDEPPARSGEDVANDAHPAGTEAVPEPANSTPQAQAQPRGAATRSQLTALRNEAIRLGLQSDHQAKMTVYEAIVGHKLSPDTQLSAEEAAKLLDRLAKFVDFDEATRWALGQASIEVEG